MNIDYNQYYNNRKNTYKKDFLNQIFLFDKDIDYLQIEPIVIPEKELEIYKIQTNEKKSKKKKILYPKD